MKILCASYERYEVSAPFVQKSEFERVNLQVPA